VIEELKKILAEKRIKTRYIDLVSYASDAGFYTLLPKAVVQPINEHEITQLFKLSQQQGVPLVFRAGGTSLSGQSITDGILVDLAQHWEKICIENGGNTVRVQPGITGGMVNAHLKKYKRKIGPDPSSISAAMMGGILSNNASGMCCGVEQNSYHTIKYLRFILPDGLSYSTEDPADYMRFESESPALFRAIGSIRKEIENNKPLHQKIREKYKTKTTVGYCLNAFIDHQHPLDILAHLLIGAEGTLAFIAEAVLETVPDHPCKSTALLFFPDIYAACQGIVPLTQAGAMMVELMDRASLRAVAHLEGMPQMVKTLPENAAALLIEFQEEDPVALANRVNLFLASAYQLSLINAPAFTADPKEQEFLWKVRKGLFPAVGAVRASGTTVVLEDIAFPVANLGDAVIELQQLFKQFHYDNAIIFGHAKDGNIHFVVTQSFDTKQEIARYDQFIRAVVDLVVNKYGGTLKAEHGTGRNMAPFVETEWGGDGYAIIKKIKETIDPLGLLNPGVIVNPHHNAHVQHLKALPLVEEEVDRCIECGYCEPVCPSRNITSSPRRRIVVRRALQLLKRSGDTKKHRLLLKQFSYDGMDTCAVDGLCAPACPVDINTGDLIKRLRREQHGFLSNNMAFLVAKHFAVVTKLIQLILATGSGVNAVFGKKTMTRITTVLRKISPSIPLWTAQLQSPPSLRKLKTQFRHVKDNEQQVDQSNSGKKSIVYFPSCISRTLGTYENKNKNAIDTFLSICSKTNTQVIVPHQVSNACCSQIFSSKGYRKAQEYSANKTIEMLWDASNEGDFPVVVDISSCTHTLLKTRNVLSAENRKKFDALRILDTIDFLHDEVLAIATKGNKKKKIVLHPVCSVKNMNIEQKLLNIASHFSEEVIVPAQAGCCGMAGDRGFLFPELTASATAAEAKALEGETCEGYYSTTKTCEMTLSDAVKKNYTSILYLADELM
jgi:D-lactate dehydrogenase